MNENDVLNGIKDSREIHEGEDCDRPFGHVEKKIVLNIKESKKIHVTYLLTDADGEKIKNERNANRVPTAANDQVGPVKFTFNISSD